LIGLIFLTTSLDDTVCYQQRSQEACLSITPTFSVKIEYDDTLSQKCNWVEKTTGYYCLPIDLMEDAYNSAMTAFITFLLCLFPTNLFFWIMRVLYINSNPDISNNVIDENYDNGVYYMEQKSLQEESKEVISGLFQYRDSLVPRVKRQFDVYWGINSVTGNFIDESYLKSSSLLVKATTNDKGLNIPKILLSKLESIRKNTLLEFDSINNSINTKTNSCTNNRFLVLLLKDLLSSSSEIQIFDNFETFVRKTIGYSSYCYCCYYYYK